MTLKDQFISYGIASMIWAGTVFLAGHTDWFSASPLLMLTTAIVLWFIALLLYCKEHLEWR